MQLNRKRRKCAYRANKIHARYRSSSIGEIEQRGNSIHYARKEYSRFAHIDIMDLWIFCLPVLVAGEASSKQRREVVLVGNAYLGSRPPISIIAWLLGSGVLDSLLVCSNCKTLRACNSAQEPATSSKKERGQHENDC